MGKRAGNYKHGLRCKGVSDAKRKAHRAQQKREQRAKRRLTDPFYH